jgi:hypothetical protein
MGETKLVATDPNLSEPQPPIFTLVVVFQARSSSKSLSCWIENEKRQLITEYRIDNRPDLCGFLPTVTTTSFHTINIYSNIGSYCRL